MKVAVYGQYYKKDDEKYIKQLLEVFSKKNVDFFVEKKFYESFQHKIEIENCTTFSSHKELDSSFNFMFTIGGDGTILRAVTFIRNSNIPIVGINTGRLGFLATIQKDDINDAIELILTNQFTIKERSLLQVTTSPKNEKLTDLNYALNEVSISRKNTASMITIETYLDDEYLTSYWADGLILATPTGSTGYSMSCGGPIITPQAKSFALTPIAPHNLNARPLVVPDETEVKFTISGRENNFLLSLDSRTSTINNKTTVTIKKADFTLKMIQINQQTFIKTLRDKLLWGQDTRN